MWQLILKADVEFFDKEQSKTMKDTFGFYDWNSDTIYLNLQGIWHDLKQKSKRYGSNFIIKPEITDGRLINELLKVLNHELFHAGVQSAIEEKLESFIISIENKRGSKFETYMRTHFKNVLNDTIGMIWQEVGVRIHQEGLPAWKAIVSVLGKKSSYLKTLKEKLREMEFFAEMVDDSLFSNINDYILNLTKEIINDMTNKLDKQIKWAIKDIGNTDTI